MLLNPIISLNTLRLIEKNDLQRESTMYELDCFEKALAHFGTRMEIIIGLEMGGKFDSDSAYKMIKEELKQLKKIRKKHKDTDCDEC